MKFRFGAATWVIPVVAFAGAVASQPAGPAPEALRADIVRLRPLAEAMPEAKDGDWRSTRGEPGESFSEWLAAGPVTVTERRRRIDVMPLGEFTREQREVLDKTAEYLGVFYSLPVRVLPAVPMRDFPASATRVGPLGTPQRLTTHILDKVLVPAVTDETAFLIALTADDLWPGAGWNYVFGMASLDRRVGVWSMRRFGDAAGSVAERRRVVRRAIKVAAHESGHMFSMAHCVAYRCGMNGANSLPEADSQPLEFCPVCSAKLAYATRRDARARLPAMRDWYSKNGFEAEAGECARRLARLEEPVPHSERRPR